jgi:hypothetical protein
VRKDRAAENAKPERASPEVQAPFDRFAEFARKVVAVPKTEADEQERHYQKKKAKERAKKS